MQIEEVQERVDCCDSGQQTQEKPRDKEQQPSLTAEDEILRQQMDAEKVRQGAEEVQVSIEKRKRGEAVLEANEVEQHQHEEEGTPKRGRTEFVD